MLRYPAILPRTSTAWVHSRCGHHGIANEHYLAFEIAQYQKIRTAWYLCDCQFVSTCSFTRPRYYYPEDYSQLTFISSGIVASIIRATIFFGTEAFADETWASVDLVGWSIIETSVYIITCCLPNLRPLVSHYTPAWIKRAVKSSVTRSTGATSKGLSGIHKSTSFGHSLTSKRGHVTDDAIELTGRGDSRAWVRVDSMEALDRASSQGSPGLPLQLTQQHSQSLGTTTHITTGDKSHYPLR